MSRMKKFLAVFAALVMLVTMTAPVFAEFDDEMAGVEMFSAEGNGGTGDTTIAEDWENKISLVLGVEKEEGVKVTAYQIIKYDDDKGIYEEVLNNSITVEDGKLKPNAGDVQALAARIDELEQDNVEFSAWSADSEYNPPANIDKTKLYTYKGLAPGTWMIIVTGSSKYLYNPAIISVLIRPTGAEGGNLDLPQGWEENAAYVKSSEPTVTKTVIPTGNIAVQSVQVGDIIKYQIAADIPNYTDLVITTKPQIICKINDVLDGMELVDTEKITVNLNQYNSEEGTEQGKAEREFLKNIIHADDGGISLILDLTSQGILPEGDSETTLTPDQEKRQFIKDHRGAKITITYYAKVITDKKVAVDRITNKVEYEYSINESVQKKEAETQHYTFGIDTGYDGTSGKVTGEFIKIKDDDGVAYTTEGEITHTKTGEKGLQGAKFQLHIGSSEGNLFADASGVNIFTTDENGRLQINGLDSDVTYYLVETHAPTGYSVNQEVIPIKITPSFTNDIPGSYSITIGNTGSQTTTNYTYNVTSDSITFTNGDPFGFKNTKLGELPSTGGIGTTVFTIGGCMLMILAAAIFFASRRKDSK